MQNALNLVTISEASTLLHAVIGNAFKNKKIAQNVYIHGPIGVGKSSIINQAASVLSEQLGEQVGVIDIRLSAMEESMVQGIPFVAETGEVGTFEKGGKTFEFKDRDMFFSTPSWWPKDDGKHYILFLDEFSNAPVQVQQAAYRLILDRSIQNGKVLPDTVAIVAAGNMKTDKTGVKTVLPAVANRFGMHLTIDGNRIAQSFLEHAFNAGFDNSIIGFIAYKGANVHCPPSDGEPAFATSRSWEFLNEHLLNEDIANDDHLLTIAAAGAVGTPIAVEFMGFRQYNDVLPNWRDIRSKGVEYTVPRNDQGLQFAICSAIGAEFVDALTMSDAEESNKHVENLCSVMTQLPKEVKVVAYRLIRSNRDALKRFIKNPSLMADFKQIASSVKL